MLDENEKFKTLCRKRLLSLKLKVELSLVDLLLAFIEPSDLAAFSKSFSCLLLSTIAKTTQTRLKFILL